MWFGQAFSKSAGKLDEYKTLVGHAEKRKYREEWAKKRWASTQEEFRKRVSYKRIDTTIGTYMSFWMVVGSEGGTVNHEAAQKSSILAAVKYCSKCVAMGAPWVLVNNMTERVDFLKVKHQYEEHLEQIGKRSRL